MIHLLKGQDLSTIYWHKGNKTRKTVEEIYGGKLYYNLSTNFLICILFDII